MSFTTLLELLLLRFKISCKTGWKASYKCCMFRFYIIFFLDCSVLLVSDLNMLYFMSSQPVTIWLLWSIYLITRFWVFFSFHTLMVIVLWTSLTYELDLFVVYPFSHNNVNLYTISIIYLKFYFVSPNIRVLRRKHSHDKQCKNQHISSVFFLFFGILCHMGTKS